MSAAELISELTDICTRQAEIIKAQAYTLALLDAEIKEEEALAQRNRLRALGAEIDE